MQTISGLTSIPFFFAWKIRKSVDRYFRGPSSSSLFSYISQVKCFCVFFGLCVSVSESFLLLFAKIICLFFDNKIYIYLLDDKYLKLWLNIIL